MPHLDQYLATRTPEGGRNDALFRAVLEARENCWTESDIRNQLGAAATRDGLSSAEISTTMDSAFRRPVSLKKQRKRTERGPANPLDWDAVIGRDTVPSADLTSMPAPRDNWRSADLREFMEALFFEGEFVSYNTSFSQDAEGVIKPAGKGTFTRTQDDIIERGIDGAFDEAGVWVRLNPMDGEGVTDANVTDFRHVLVESDSLPVEEQWRIIQELKIPCAAVVHSGGKSIHAAVSIDAGDDRAEYDRRVKDLYTLLGEHGFIVDAKNKNPSRLSRLPGVTRNGRPQYLLATQLGCPSWEAWQSHLAAAQAPDEDELTPANIAGWATLEAPAVPWCFAGTIPENAVTGLTGAPAAGKSNFAAALLVSRAIGKALYPAFIPEAPARVMWIENEDPELQLRRMVRRIFDGFNLTAQDVRVFEQNTTIFCEQNCVLAVAERDKVVGTPTYQWLWRNIQKTRPRLLVLNPRVSLAHIEENSNPQVDGFFQLLRGLLHVNPTMSIVLVHHSSKAGRSEQGMSAARGAFAAAGAVRAEFTLTTVTAEDPDIKPFGMGASELQNTVRLVMAKQSYGERWQHPTYFLRDVGPVTGGLLRQFVPEKRQNTQRSHKIEELASLIAVKLGTNPDKLSANTIIRARTEEAKQFKSRLCDEHLTNISETQMREAYKLAVMNKWITETETKISAGQTALIPYANQQVLEELGHA